VTVGLFATVMMERVPWERPDALDVMSSGVDTGYLVEWHPGGRLARLQNTNTPLANGIQLNAEGRFISYAAWSGKQIRKYDRLFFMGLSRAAVAVSSVLNWSNPGFGRAAAETLVRRGYTSSPRSATARAGTLPMRRIAICCRLRTIGAS
jgi:hypothetical protein